MSIYLNVPKLYHRYLVRHQLRQGALQWLCGGVIFWLGMSVLFHQPLEYSLAGAILSAMPFITALLSCFFLDQQWIYCFDDRGIRFDNRPGLPPNSQKNLMLWQIPLYSAFWSRLCRVEWKQQTLVSIENTQWRGLPVLRLKLAARKQWAKGQFATTKTLLIVYAPEDEEQVLKQIIPLLQRHRIPSGPIMSIDV